MSVKCLDVQYLFIKLSDAAVILNIRLADGD